MDKPKQTEIPPELFEQLFPWPEDVPLRRPRFGNVTQQKSARLPDRAARVEDPPTSAPPFRLVWESDDLGLKVRVEEEVGEHAGQLSVTVLSSEPEKRQGKQVKVLLIGERHDAHECNMLVAVDLDQECLDPMEASGKKRIGCFGRKLLGTVPDLRARLGDGEVSVEAFLLV